MHPGRRTAARGRSAEVRPVSDASEESSDSTDVRDPSDDDEPEESLKRREELAKRVREANHFSTNWPR